MDPEDTRILQLTARNLANFASTLNSSSSSSSSSSSGSLAERAAASGGNDGGGAVGDADMVGGALSHTWELLDKLLAKLSVASSRPLDQHSAVVPSGAGGDPFEKGMLKNLRAGEGSALHPFFGRLRRDNYEEVVKALMVRSWVLFRYIISSS